MVRDEVGVEEERIERVVAVETLVEVVFTVEPRVDDFAMDNDDRVVREGETGVDELEVTGGGEDNAADDDEDEVGIPAKEVEGLTT